MLAQLPTRHCEAIDAIARAVRSDGVTTEAARRYDG